MNFLASLRIRLRPDCCGHDMHDMHDVPISVGVVSYKYFVRVVSYIPLAHAPHSLAWLPFAEKVAAADNKKADNKHADASIGYHACRLQHTNHKHATYRHTDKKDVDKNQGYHYIGKPCMHASPYWSAVAAALVNALRQLATFSVVPAANSNPLCPLSIQQCAVCVLLQRGACSVA